MFNVWLGDDGIVRQIWAPQAEISLAQAKESVAAIVRLTHGEYIPLLVDMRRTKFVDREARAYYASPASRITKAVALLVSSPVSRVLANFFLGLHTPKVPIKMFTSETEALKWLKRFVA
ncbi:MAG: STAS/SEC14 domain-containing protein [Chloroflexi bacterium]|nr:STAS/SEC14 domain-containing protein [Chloroflexota bacterium]MBI3732467.1 STAS/SEC14 domain-containing protein [Chloroflexota bacterium]